MPKKGNNNQKSFKPMEEIEESESKLMVIRPKREASKNVSKIVASILYSSIPYALTVNGNNNIKNNNIFFIVPPKKDLLLSP